MVKIITKKAERKIKEDAKKKTDAELLELGKMLQDFYDQGYVSKKKSIVFAFLKGIASGFGAIVGGTIVVALLLWMLSLLGHVPFVGNFTDSVEQTVQKQ